LAQAAPLVLRLAVLAAPAVLHRLAHTAQRQAGLGALEYLRRGPRGLAARRVAQVAGPLIMRGARAVPQLIIRQVLEGLQITVPL